MRGADRFRSQLVALRAAQEIATEKAVESAANQVRDDTVDQLMLREHAPGTPTPSRRGEPPAMITGALKASVVVSPARRLGMRWERKVGATTDYARIQELGGTAGFNSQLPPRPYLRPAIDKATPRVYVLFREAWEAGNHL